jgi:hypothetical protein
MLRRRYHGVHRGSTVETRDAGRRYGSVGLRKALNHRTLGRNGAVGIHCNSATYRCVTWKTGTREVHHGSTIETRDRGVGDSPPPVCPWHCPGNTVAASQAGARRALPTWPCRSPKALMRLTTCWLEGSSIACAELAAVLVAVWEACGRVPQCQNARGSGNPASANQPRPDSRGHEVSACRAGINGPVSLTAPGLPGVSAVGLRTLKGLTRAWVNAVKRRVKHPDVRTANL